MQYVLVHGTWQGSSCWKYLVEILIAQGHQVCSFDLLDMETILGL